jgi:hypothetical protein
MPSCRLSDVEITEIADWERAIDLGETTQRKPKHRDHEQISANAKAMKAADAKAIKALPNMERRRIRANVRVERAPERKFRAERVAERKSSSCAVGLWSIHMGRYTCVPSKEQKMKLAFANIGVFDDYFGMPGIEYLGQGEPTLTDVSPEAVWNVFHQLGVPCGGAFRVVSTTLLERSQCARLVEELDSRCGADVDFKLSLREDELAHMIGLVKLQWLASFLPRGFNRIYLRRCVAHGKCIRFHVDEALWTMQIPLNDPEEYQGGRLTYAAKDGSLICPHRAAGTGTIHDNATVHGVTTLEGGVRYGLYFLENPRDM